MIKERLMNVIILQGKFTILERAEVIQDINFSRDSINDLFLQYENDFSDSTREEIIRWFHGLIISENVVKIYWLSTNEGVSVKFKTFAENFDEFWYPSSDDVWITGNDGSWLIQIDHEEKFSFFKKI